MASFWAIVTGELQSRFFDRIFRIGVDVICPVFQYPDDPVNPVKIIKKQHILKLACSPGDCYAKNQSVPGAATFGLTPGYGISPLGDDDDNAVPLWSKSDAKPNKMDDKGQFGDFVVGDSLSKNRSQFRRNRPTLK